MRAEAGESLGLQGPSVAMEPVRASVPTSGSASQGQTSGQMSGQSSAQTSGRASGPALAVLLGLSLSHLLNDLVQSLLPALYPLLKTGFHLDFGQIGLITFVFQGTASLLQPAVGLYTDRRPLPFSLAAGMGLSLAGLALLSVASAYGALLAAAALIGLGSAIFHPEASRVARLASGGRCWPPSSWCRAARGASRGSASRRWPASSCWLWSAAGMPSSLRGRRGSPGRVRGLRRGR